LPAHLLFVEDDPLIRRALAEGLRAKGHRVREADGVGAAKASLSNETYDLVVTDWRLPDGSGFDVMADLDAIQPGIPVIVVTGHASVELAVEAMRRGAFTYVEKPVDTDALDAHVQKALETGDLRRENRRLRRLTEPGTGADGVLGTSPVAVALRDQVRRIAASPARAVLLEGESGSGKGLVARAIHAESSRAGRPFVSITCSAVPEALLESELFGHEAGAFTDARRRKMGLLEAAEGGTLFLDEIGDMGAAIQAKLLGVLEERRFRRVGGLREIDVDVRIISATHRDLRALLQAGRFREDLLYRLRVVPLRIAPLRERLEDVPLLARRFAADLAAEWGRPTLALTEAALATLTRRPWPGNVRELRNVVERAVILARQDVIDAGDVSEDGDARTPIGEGFVLPMEGVRVEELMDDLVRQAMKRTDGNQSAAARLVGLSRDQLRYRLQRLGLLGKSGTEASSA